MIVTYDFHANISKRMVGLADGVVAYETHPHVDLANTGRRGAQLMLKRLAHNQPYHLAFICIPALLGPTNIRTDEGPMAELIELARRHEKDPEVESASVFMGFPNADTADTAASVVITAISKQKAVEVAQSIARAIWERRYLFNPPLPNLHEALQEAIESQDGPVILGEMCDGVLQGGAADGTAVLEALIEHGVERTVVATIADPEAVQQAIQAGVGQEIELLIGGKIDADNFKPLKVSGIIKLISDGNYISKGPVKKGMLIKMGRAVVLKVDEINVVLTEKRTAPYDPALLRSLGIEPTDKKIIALKQGAMSRAAYKDIVTKIIPFLSPGWGTVDYTSLPYQHVQRPIFPLDDLAFNAEHVTTTQREAGIHQG